MYQSIVSVKNTSKIIILTLWKFLLNLTVVISINLRKYVGVNTDLPKLNYAGAVSGNYGGPRVKVKQLKSRFHAKLIDFNIVYILSNYSYLSKNSLEKIKDAGIPIVLNQNGVYAPGWFGAGWESKNLPNIHAYELCDYVFWQSHFAKKSSEQFLSTKNKSGEILYNAVDLKRYFPKKIERRKEFIFLVAGNFRSKASFYQIEASLKALSCLTKEKDTKLRIAGLSNEMKNLTMKLAIELKVYEKIELVGGYSQESWPEIVRDSDVYMALKFQDTCPNLVLEAMSSGLPVLYSASGGTPELVNDKCGIGLSVSGDWFTNPHAPNIDDIANAMRILKNEKKVMSLAARSCAEDRFGIELWYQRHLQLFSRYLEKE